ncbi:MAG: hypothetical protein ACE5G0_12135 [Rhodothermales bacterium]
MRRSQSYFITREKHPASGLRPVSDRRCLFRADKDEAKWKFYESAAQNIGVNNRIFVDDEERALAWVMAKEPE